MNRFTNPVLNMSKEFRISFIVLCITFAIASLAMLTHSAGVDRTIDAQMTRYAFEFLEAITDGPFNTFLFSVRKYTLLPSVLLGFLYGGVVGFKLLIGSIPSIADIPAYLFGTPVAINIVGRLFTLGAGILTIVLTFLTSKKLFPKVSPLYAVSLLLSSLLFLTYITAVRPHVLVTAMIMLTLFTSIRFTEKRTNLRGFMAFGSAGLAFCTLQSGFFAIIFPLWAYLFLAYLFKGNRIRWRGLCEKKLWGFGLFFFVFSIILGYPFVLAPFFGADAVFGLDLGHDQMGLSSWSGEGFINIKRAFLGSEIFLALFAIAGAWQIWKSKKLPQGLLLAVYAFVLIYFIVFGLYADTGIRFFIPTLPLLALIGAGALAASPRHIKMLFVLCVLAIHLKFAFLAIQPNTYEVASNFVQKETTGTVATDLPVYFLGIPQTRASIGSPSMAREHYIAGLSEDLSGARDIISYEELDKAEVFIKRTEQGIENLEPEWEICKYTSQSPTYGEGLLWSDVYYSMYWLFRIERLGPSIAVYCRA